MLVLARERGQSIVIDHSIVVTVVQVRGDKVRLGITAPREMAVHREEVERRIAPADNDPSATLTDCG